MLHTLFFAPLVLTGPVGPAESFTPLNAFGITARASGLEFDASLDHGLEARGKLLALGGKGEFGVATGLTAPRHVDVTLTELDAAQVAALAGDGLPAVLRDKLKGRIGKVALNVRGDAVTFKAEKFRLAGDWLSRAEGTADLKTRKYKLKLWAFGGLMEAEGALPADLSPSPEGSLGNSLGRKAPASASR
jgi:hypothetical protein